MSWPVWSQNAVLYFSATKILHHNSRRHWQILGEIIRTFHHCRHQIRRICSSRPKAVDQYVTALLTDHNDLFSRKGHMSPVILTSQSSGPTFCKNGWQAMLSPAIPGVPHVSYFLPILLRNAVLMYLILVTWFMKGTQLRVKWNF